MTRNLRLDEHVAEALTAYALRLSAEAGRRLTLSEAVATLLGLNGAQAPTGGQS